MLPHTVNANQLRWLGEEADGRRQEDLALVWDDDKLILVNASDSRAKGALFKVRTDLQGDGGMRGGGTIGITYNGKSLDVGAADAAFFTQSAVEKFVLPYYTRMWTPAKIQALKNKLFASGVIVALHDPPSITSAINEDDPSEFKAMRFEG